MHACNRETIYSAGSGDWTQARLITVSGSARTVPMSQRDIRIRIHAPCFNRSTDLDAIWQVHTQCVRCGPWPPRGGEILGSKPPRQNMQLQIAAELSVLCCHLANTNEQFRLLPNYFGPCYYMCYYNKKRTSCIILNYSYLDITVCAALAIHRHWVGRNHRVPKIDLQLRLPQRHCLRSRDDSIADQRSSIISYVNYRLLMIIVYMACILNYADKIAVFNLFWLIVQYLERWPLLSVKRGCREGC